MQECLVPSGTLPPSQAHAPTTPNPAPPIQPFSSAQESTNVTTAAPGESTEINLGTGSDVPASGASQSPAQSSQAAKGLPLLGEVDELNRTVERIAGILENGNRILVGTQNSFLSVSGIIKRPA